jgi:hypothetical protein
MNFNAFNWNTAQTVLSFVAAGILWILVASGCTANADGSIAECSASFLSGWFTPKVLMTIGAIGMTIKLTVLPMFQPGGWLYNMFAPKVPVTAKVNEPGTVTPAQVAK